MNPVTIRAGAIARDARFFAAFEVRAANDAGAALVIAAAVIVPVIALVCAAYYGPVTGLTVLREGRVAFTAERFSGSVRDAFMSAIGR
jgi:hypothetical protein